VVRLGAVRDALGERLREAGARKRELVALEDVVVPAEQVLREIGGGVRAQRDRLASGAEGPLDALRGRARSLDAADAGVDVGEKPVLLAHRLGREDEAAERTGGVRGRADEGLAGRREVALGALEGVVGGVDRAAGG